MHIYLFMAMFSPRAFWPARGMAVIYFTPVDGCTSEKRLSLTATDDSFGLCIFIFLFAESKTGRKVCSLESRCLTKSLLNMEKNEMDNI